VLAPDVTATTDNAINVPVTDNQNNQATEEKKYSQADIDAMIGKRLATERRSGNENKHNVLLKRKSLKLYQLHPLINMSLLKPMQKHWHIGKPKN